jgi:tripartite ATP-independent transporter DctM subunit
MSLIMVGVIGFLVLFFLILIVRIPIGFGMILVGVAGMAYLTSIDTAISFLGRQVFVTAASYDMAMVAMFIFMGELAFNTGIGEKAYESILKWLGSLRGSLAMATVGACGAFAAVCGSSPATAATIGSMALPAMKKYGYDDSFATGCVAAGGTIGILIPPSLGFILFGLLTEQSIAKLYLAGIVPGLLLVGLFMITCYIFAGLKPPTFVAPPSTIREKLSAIKGLLEIVILFVIVIGGLGLGLFTPTAAGAIGAFGVLVMGLVKKSLSWQTFLNCLTQTTTTVGMIVTIFVGAMIFNYFLAASTLTFQLGKLIGELSVPPVVTIVAILLMWLGLGCIMDAVGMIVLTVPVVYPIIVTLGFNPIWFAVLGVIMIEAGLITPPVGMNVYIIGGIAKGVPLSIIFRGVIPFLIALLVCVGLVVAFPQIALFLPSAM